MRGSTGHNGEEKLTLLTVKPIQQIKAQEGQPSVLTGWTVRGQGRDRNKHKEAEPGVFLMRKGWGVDHCQSDKGSGCTEPLLTISIIKKGKRIFCIRRARRKSIMPALRN